MRINSIHIRGFGCIVDRRYDFPADRAVLVLENNETGKSTLSAAILAALCGLPKRKQRDEVMKLKDVYAPWHGDSYAVEIEIETGGRRWVIDRNFAGNKFTVRDYETNKDVSARFDLDLAYSFLHLCRDDFQRIAFVTGKDVQQFSSSPDLRARLTATVEGSENESGADSAIAALEGTRYTLAGGGPILIKNAIDRLAKAIASKEDRITEMEADLDSAEEQVRSLDDAKARRAEMDAQFDRLDNEFRAAMLAEVREQIASAEKNVREAEELHRELDDLEPYAAFPIARRDQLSSAIARLREHRRRIDQASSETTGMNREADEIRVRLREHEQFDLATDENLVALRSSEAEVETAQQARDAARKQSRVPAHSSGRLLSYSLAALGGIVALACMASMILRVLPVTSSLVGLLIGVIVAAVGFIGINRRAISDAGNRAVLDQASRTLDSARSRATALLSALGTRCEEHADITQVLSRTEAALAGYLAGRRRLREIEQGLARLARDCAELEDRVNDEQTAIAGILSEAGVDTRLSINEAMRQFDDSEKRYRRYCQVRDDLLPAALNRMPSPESVAKLREEEKRLEITQHAELRRSVRLELTAPFDGAQDAGHVHKHPTRSSTEIENERLVVRKDREAVIEEIRELEHRIGARVDAYRREYPVLRDEIAQMRSELDRVSRFGLALEKAAQVLREVSEDTHRRWAVALNDRASSILPCLNPDYDMPRFDDSLDFTIRRVADGRIIEKNAIDACLSTGAKDQIYLAVRLAICEELSKLGESIPIILDDPLISADDERFERGLRYLVEEVAREHQVIILSCHKSRHERLSEQEWFGRAWSSRSGVGII